MYAVLSLGGAALLKPKMDGDIATASMVRAAMCVTENADAISTTVRVSEYLWIS